MSRFVLVQRTGQYEWFSALAGGLPLQGPSHAVGDADCSFTKGTARCDMYV